jgi:DNA helicase II / ATP-dependent DNA helicase PcrA
MVNSTSHVHSAHVTPHVHKIYGAPGTGKTTTLIRTVKDVMLRENIPIQDVAFVSFTKTAVAEAKSRMGYSGSDLQYFKTMHAICMHMLGLKSDKLWKKHLDTMPVKLSDEMIDSIQRDKSVAHTQMRTDSVTNLNDFLYTQYMSSRVALLPKGVAPKDVLAKGQQVVYNSFAEKYDKWMSENGYHDFTTMLEKAYEMKKVPNVSILCVDEWQDLSPLQVRLVELWTENIPYTIHAGDDDQTIFEWAGARHGDFISFPQCEYRDKKEDVLAKTYRLPQSILELSMAYISRNQNRVKKDVTSACAEDGKIGVFNKYQVAEILKRRVKTDSIKILMRTNAYTNKLKKDLLALGVPIITHPKVYGAVGIIERASDTITVNDLQKIVNSTKFPSVGLFTRGGKKEMQKYIETLNMQSIDSVPVNTLLNHGAKEKLVCALQNSDVTILKENPQLLQQMHAMYKQYGDDVNRIEVSTIHKQKGAEADTVVICMDTSFQASNPKTQEEIEAERRVWYVAMTRAKKRLLFMQPTYSKYADPVYNFIRVFLQNKQSVFTEQKT